MSGARDSVPPPRWEAAGATHIAEQHRPPGPAPRRRLPARVTGLLAALATLAGLAVAVTVIGGQSADRSLGDYSFSTRYPAGWTLTSGQPVVGVTNYALGSTSAKLNDLGIPVPGEVGITVSEYSLSTLATLADPGAATQSPLLLLPHVIGVPRFAESRSVLNQLHTTSLGGAPAAAIQYSYTYDGVVNIQSDVVARHGSTIVSIESDADPQAAGQASGAMTKAIAQWRWRQTISRPETRIDAAAPSDPRNIFGYYDVVGNIISTHGFSGESPGDLLLRTWLIRRTCTSSGCHLVLTRNLAAATGLPPISAVLFPTRADWTAHFTETQGCPAAGSPVRTTEYSTFSMWATSDGLQATTHGHSPKVTGCAANNENIHWYANKQATPGQTQPANPS